MPRTSTVGVSSAASDVYKGQDNIRDVIGFPKTQTGADLMCEAPGAADEAQRDELGIIMRQPVETTEQA